MLNGLKIQSAQTSHLATDILDTATEESLLRWKVIPVYQTEPRPTFTYSEYKKGMQENLLISEWAIRGPPSRCLLLTPLPHNKRLFPDNYYTMEEEASVGTYKIGNTYDDKTVELAVKDVFCSCLHLMALNVMCNMPSDRDFYQVTSDEGNQRVCLHVTEPYVHIPRYNCICEPDEECECSGRHYREVLGNLLIRYDVDLSKKDGTYDGWNDCIGSTANECTGERSNTDTLSHRLHRALMQDDWCKHLCHILQPDISEIPASVVQFKVPTSMDESSRRHVKGCLKKVTSDFDLEPLNATILDALSKCTHVDLSDDHKVLALWEIYQGYTLPASRCIPTTHAKPEHVRTLLGFFDHRVADMIAKHRTANVLT